MEMTKMKTLEDLLNEEEVELQEEECEDEMFEEIQVSGLKDEQDREDDEHSELERDEEDVEKLEDELHDLKIKLELLSWEEEEQKNQSVTDYAEMLVGWLLYDMQIEALVVKLLLEILIGGDVKVIW